MKTGKVIDKINKIKKNKELTVKVTVDKMVFEIKKITVADNLYIMIDGPQQNPRIHPFTASATTIAFSLENVMKEIGYSMKNPKLHCSTNESLLSCNASF